MIHTVVVLAAFLAVVVALAVPLSAYLQRVFEGRRTWLDPCLRPVERAIYRIAGVDSGREQSWSTYATSLILFTAAGTLLLYLILRIQDVLPLNPADLAAPRPALSADTALSFSTTTTWQAYAGESTMSYLSQMLGLTAQNILAGAVGLAAGVAFIRGVARQGMETLGNFWVDLVRGTLWVMLPLALIFALVLASQGVIATLGGPVTAKTVEGVEQVIPRGPVAAMVAVNNLGTNGGGFFNANGAHPLEDPSPFTNFVQKLAIALVPAALVLTFGRMAGRRRQAWAIFIVMAAFLAVSVLAIAVAEERGNRQVTSLGVPAFANLEGKETRLGIGDTSLVVGITAGGSTGSTAHANDSLQPLSGAVLFFNLALGGIAFGGLGTGLYTMVILAMLTAFVGSQMVGRAAAFMGKKIEQRSMTLTLIFLLIAPFSILCLAALAAVTDGGVSRLAQDGPHGLTALLVTYSTNVANNGQGFASLGADTNFYHATTMIGMTAGRLFLTITALALAGQLVREARSAEHAGALTTDTPLFTGFFAGVIIVVNGLTLLPALALGPVLEQLTL